MNEQVKTVRSVRILLASDNTKWISPLLHTLETTGYQVQVADGYEAVLFHLEEKKFEVVLLEVSSDNSIELAVEAALRVKRQNPQQRIGYLADPVLHSRGLAGDFLLRRSSRSLAEDLARVLPLSPSANGGD